MSSRFFASGDSSESEEEVQESQKVTAEPAQTSARYALESSDEEDDQQRVVRSEKDKRFDSLKSIIKSLQNAIKIADWVNILNQFEKLQVELGKAKKVVRKEGIPKFYFKSVVDLDTYFKDTSKNKEALKKLNKANQKAFAAMKQKLLKHNKEFEKEIATYLQNPLGSDEEEEEEKTAPSKKTAEKKEESDSDDDDFKKEDSDSESSDSDIDLNQKSMFERKFWEKKPKDIERDRKRAEQKAIMDSQKKEIDKERGQQREKARQIRAQEKKEKQQTSQGAKKEVELTPEMIAKKLKEILASRGRKGTDRKQVIDDLRLLASKSRAPLTLLKVQITLCSALFETSLNRGTHMQVDYWKAALTELNAIITSLNENPQIRLSEDEEVEEKDDDDDDVIEKAIGSLISTDEKKEQKKPKEEETKIDGDKVEYVIGNLYSFIHRIAAEFTNSLRHIDHHTPEYLSRLRDERDLILLIARAQDYYTKIKKEQFIARVILRRMELVYYHYNPELDQQGKNSERKGTGKSVRWDTVPLEELGEYLYKHGTGRDRTRALLFHIYYLSIHNRFTEARDLVLMSHIQDTINEADIKTRILFNRAIAQFGLCAFRVGEYRHALNSLADFYPSNRIKELLAQGISRSYADRNLEKEKEERRRQYPFHMHINIDMIEAFHLISAMFEEVPNMAIYSSNRRRIISKTFRHHFNHHSRQAFNGPPENTRDGVMAATAALQEADWQKSFRYIKDLKMWTFVPHASTVQNLIQNKIQEVALRTYLLSYAPQYISVDVKTLSTMFQLDDKLIHKVASDMIFTDQLQGAWDQTSSVILMATQPLSRLQRTALAFSEKAALFVEQNERLMDQRNGYYARAGDRGDRGDRGGWGNTSQKRPAASSASRVHW